MWRGAVPSGLGRVLRAAFAPGAAFWDETDYAARGYYSFWLDAAAPPTNAVEALILAHLRPLVEPLLLEAQAAAAAAKGGEGGKGGATEAAASSLVGCEWWVHSRDAGKASVGHQLHYDTDEASLAETGEVFHPLLSSVVYLTGAGCAPTLVLDQFPTMGTKEAAGVSVAANNAAEAANSHANAGGQKVAKQENAEEEEEEEGEEKDEDEESDDDDDGKFAARGWLAKPEDGAFMVFPGDRLHGVLPDAPTPTAAAAAASGNSGSCGHRLTLMVGWWTRDPNAAAERAARVGSGGKAQWAKPESAHRHRNKRTFRLGPCAPVPPPARSATWVKALALADPGGLGAESVAPQPIAVQELSPVWEKLERRRPEGGDESQEDDNDDEFENDEEDEEEAEEDSAGRVKKKMRLEPLRAEEEGTEPSGEEDEEDAEEVFGVTASDESEASGGESGGSGDEGGGDAEGGGTEESDGSEELAGEWVEEPAIPPRLDGHFFVAGASAFSPTAKVAHF
jgi:hypothetical protein